MTGLPWVGATRFLAGASMSPIERALALALQAHVGQTDKAGRPYIGHVLRVWAGVKDDDKATQAAALLHDVFADAPDGVPARLLEGFPEEVVRAVKALTHHDGEAYKAYL